MCVSFFQTLQTCLQKTGSYWMLDKLTWGQTMDNLEWLKEMDPLLGATDHRAQVFCQAL